MALSELFFSMAPESRYTLLEAPPPRSTATQESTEAAHAAIDPPEGYREGGSRLGSFKSAVASLVRAQTVPLWKSLHR